MFNTLWFESGIGNDVLEQSEETKLQCVIKTSADSSSDQNGVSAKFLPCITYTPQRCLRQVLATNSLHLVEMKSTALLPYVTCYRPFCSVNGNAIIHSHKSFLNLNFALFSFIIYQLYIHFQSLIVRLTILLLLLLSLYSKLPLS